MNQDRLYYWTVVNHRNLTNHYYTDRLVYWSYKRMLHKTKQEFYYGKKLYKE